MKKVLKALFIALLHATVLLAYWFFATATTWTSFEPDDATHVNYQMLADAFLAGRTWIEPEPSPQLLALSNPYDTEAHEKLALIDASLYQQHYYLYFGPAPAMIRAAWTAITKQPARASMIDFGYAVIAYAATLYITHALRRKLAPGAPRIAADLLAAGFGLTGAWTCLVARPSIYCEAVLAGSMWVLLGTAALLRADETKRQRWLMIASFCFGMAAASRLSLIGYSFGFAAMLLWQFIRNAPSRKSTLATFTPIIAIGIALAAYNTQRFGSPVEFGGKYQLTGMRGALQRIDFHCLPDNLSNYAWYRPGFISWFPFHTSEFITRYDVPPIWVREGSFSGLLWITPIIFVAPFGLLIARRQTFAVVLACGIAVAGTIVMNLGWAATRYAHDFAPACGLLGIVAILQCLASPNPAIRRSIAGVTLAALLMATMYANAMAVSEFNLWHYDRALEVAYQSDELAISLRERFGNSWLRSYTSPANLHRPLVYEYWSPPEDRDLAIFIPNALTFTLPADFIYPSGTLRVESIAKEPIEVDIRINNSQPLTWMIEPGWQSTDIPAIWDAVPHTPIQITVTPKSAWPSQLLPIRLLGL